MRISPTLTSKGIAVICLPCLIQLSLCLTYWHFFSELERLTRQDYESKVVLGHMNWIAFLIATNALLQLQDVVSPNPSDKSYLRDYREALHSEVGELRSLFSNQTQQIEKINRMEQQISRVLVPTHGSSITGFFSSGKASTIWTEIADVRHEVLAAQRDKYTIGPELLPRVRTALLSSLAGGAVLSVASLFLLVGLFTIHIARRLSVLADNTRRFADNEELNPPMAGSDEIASLDRTFHHMAETVLEAAAKERAIIRNAVDVIFSLDREALFVAINPAAISVLGYTPQCLTGTSVLALASADEYEKVAQAIYSAINSGSGASTFEARLRKENGELIDTLWSTHWSESEQLLFCVAHDITERKEAERLRQEVLYMVSHDIRSPLMNIQCTLDILESQVPSESRQITARATASANRIMRLVNDLLDAEKIRSRSLVLEYSSFALQDLLDECIASLQTWASECGVQIDSESCDGLELYADRHRIAQVIVNILSNAVKFSPRGEKVDVYARSTDNYIEIGIADRGPGIAEQYLEKIFERFEQVRLSDGSQKKGSGLGLAICRSLVELHGGNIEVRSQVGEGSTFMVHIPARRVAT